MMRGLSLLLCLALCFAGFLTSCGGAPADANTADTTSAETTLEITTEPRMEADVPRDKNYGGATFTFLTRTINDPDWYDWNHRDIYAEAETGDPLNDAVYNRNRVIEERYNIKIREYVTQKWMDDIRKAVRAGDGSYDVVLPPLKDFPVLAQDGLLVNYKTMPYIDLTRPWWNQGCVRDLSVDNKLFCLQGDLIVMDNDATSAMVFNKKLLRDNALEDPYQLVEEGKWTLDKLTEMARAVSKDLNGDGVMYIKDDLFGCITQADSTLAFFYGAGGKIASKDENDLPVISFNEQRTYDAFEKISALMLDEEHVVELHRYMGKFPIYEEQTKMISENRALFSWIRMRVVETLRGMDGDFGIVPLPKLDEQQPQYWHQINSHTSTVISVPRSTPDLERTAIILEALSAESRYTLQPAYYDVNLYGKYTRDEESRKMLDIIFGTTVYDIGEVYNFGNFSQTIVWFPTKKKNNYASEYDKMSAKIQVDVDKIVAKYRAVE